MIDFNQLKDTTVNYFKNFNFKNYINTIINLITKPKETWESIKNENLNSKDILLQFVLPSVIISVLVHLLQSFFINFFPLKSVLFADLFQLAGYFIFTNIAFYVATIKFFEAEMTKQASYQIVGYTLSSSLLVSTLISLLTILVGLIGFLATPFLLYFIYVAYLGFATLTTINKKAYYFIALILTNIIVGFIISSINCTSCH